MNTWPIAGGASMQILSQRPYLSIPKRKHHPRPHATSQKLTLGPSLRLSFSKYRMVPYSPFFFWSCLYWWNLSINRVAVTHAFQYAARTQADNLLFWFWSTWVLHSLHCSWLHHAPSALPHKNQRSSVLLCFYAFFLHF